MNKKYANSIGSIIFITILSQSISLVRESIFAFYYGASMATDAFVIASQIPVTLFAIFSSAINTVILPLYISKRRNDGKYQADSFLKSFIIVFVFLSLIFILLGEMCTVPIVKLFAPSFVGEKLDLTVFYSRILFPTVIFSGITNIVIAAYNAENRFLYPILAALSQNIVLITVMCLFSKSKGNIVAVWGIAGGIFLNFILIAVGYTKVFLAEIQLKKMASDIRLVLYRVIPITFGVGIAEINRVIDRAIASGLDTGSITALNYANKLTVVFASLILSAITTVSFKEFSTDYVKHKYKRRSYALNQYISLVIAFLIPITIGATFLKKEVIVIAFGRGNFDWYAIQQTVDVFMYSVWGIVFIAVREILSKYFYSSGDTKTPLINSGISVGVNIVLNIILSKYMGAAGLALATTISSVSVCILLLVSVKRKEKYCNISLLCKNTAFICLASLMMFGTLISFNTVIIISNIPIKFFINVFIGMGVYFIIFSLISKETVKALINLLFESRDSE